jgi:lipocalin
MLRRLSCQQAEVAPCFLPSSFAGPYWIVAFSVQEGWALVSGGPPTLPGVNGTCRTGSGVNGSGLWIFTRQQRRDDAIVTKVRSIATRKGPTGPHMHGHRAE